MKLKLFSSISILSLSVLLPIIPSVTLKAHSCAMTDVLTQVAIHDSQTPATQEGNFNMGSDGNCLGNSTTGNTNQVFFGSDNVEQTYEGNQFVGGSEYNPTGVNSPVIQTPVHVPVDVSVPSSTFGDF